METGGSSPSILTSARARPISSSASRSAVSRRSASSGSRLPAGKGDLARVVAQVGAAAGEHRVGLAARVAEQRHQHRRRNLILNPGQSAQAVGRGGLEDGCAGGEPAGIKRAVRMSPGGGRSARGVPRTSPPRRACGARGTSPRSPADAPPARREGPPAARRLESVGRPASAGVYSTATSTSPISQPLRAAYISSVIAHAQREARRQQLLRIGAGVLAACLGALVDRRAHGRVPARCA